MFFSKKIRRTAVPHATIVDPLLAIVRRQQPDHLSSGMDYMMTHARACTYYSLYPKIEAIRALTMQTLS